MNRPSSSYGANNRYMQAFAGDDPDNPTHRVWKLPEIELPAQAVLLLPHRGNSVHAPGRDDCWNVGSPPGCNNNQTGYIVARHRHNGGANFLLGDGHAKWYKGPEPFYAQSRSGVAWRRSRAPHASAWFRED